MLSRPWGALQAMAFTLCEVGGEDLFLSRFIVFMLPPGSQVRMRVRTFSLLLMALSPELRTYLAQRKCSEILC